MRHRDDNHEPPHRAELIAAGLSRESENRDTQNSLSLRFVFQCQKNRKGDTACVI